MGFGGFSVKRATGITKAKRAVAKATGIPTTKAGRRQKALRITNGLVGIGGTAKEKAEVASAEENSQDPAVNTIANIIILVAVVIAIGVGWWFVSFLMSVFSHRPAS